MSDNQEVEYIELKSFRQTWLSKEVLHKSPAASLCTIGGKQWVQLYNSSGESLTCIKNRTGRLAKDVVKLNGKWYWVVEKG